MAVTPFSAAAGGTLTVPPAASLLKNYCLADGFSICLMMPSIPSVPPRTGGNPLKLSRQIVYLSPAPLLMASITRSRLKLPGFWRGGNSRKLCSHSPI
jgi:hypothetical protein